MHTRQEIDPGRHIDWSRTSRDYAEHRPGPPARMYELLAQLGIGLRGQRLLDLGTGTGLVAREMARRGAIVCGTDIAEGQIATAREEAAREGLAIDFQVAPAEHCPHPAASFDAATACQCWLYFDAPRVCEELRRVLVPGARFATMHFSWVPALDRIAKASEALALQFNPAWKGANWSGEIPSVPAWTKGLARVQGMFWFDEPIAFTRESWRGRMRACRGVGATLSADEVQAFDAEHARLLERIAPERFTVLHRIDAHVMTLA